MVEMNGREKAARAPMCIRRIRLTDSPVLRPGATLPVWYVGWNSKCRLCIWAWAWDRHDLAIERGVGHLRASHAYGRSGDESVAVAGQP